MVKIHCFQDQKCKNIYVIIVLWHDVICSHDDHNIILDLDNVPCFAIRVGGRDRRNNCHCVETVVDQDFVKALESLFD